MVALEIGLGIVVITALVMEAFFSGNPGFAQLREKNTTFEEHALSPLTIEKLESAMGVRNPKLTTLLPLEAL